MPLISGNPTAPALFFNSVAEIESFDVTEFTTGDLCYLTTTNTYYRLDKAANTLRTGTNVLYTRESNATYTPVPGTGRWVLFAAVAAVNPSAYSEQSIVLAIPTPGPTVELLTTLAALPRAGIVQIDASFTATTAGNAAIVSILVEKSVNGGAFAQLGVGKAAASIPVTSNGSGALSLLDVGALGDVLAYRIQLASSAAAVTIDPTANGHLSLRAVFSPTPT